MARRLIAFLVAYFALCTLAICLWGDLDVRQFHSVMACWPREGRPNFFSHFATWDAAHYLLLSETGYRQDVASCAFYPLWPWVTQALSVLTGGSHLIAGLILANLFSWAGLVLFHKRIGELYSIQAANLAVILILAFPGSLFFHFHYTEGLFFFLLMILWHSLEKRRYGLAWASAFLLPLTRAIGLFCLFPIAVHLAKHHPPKFLTRLTASFPCWKSAAPGSNFAGVGEQSTHEAKHLSFARSASPWLLLFAPLLGWICYLAFMGAMTGNPFEGFRAQQHWGVQSISNMFDLPKFVLSFFDPTTWHGFRGSVLDRSLFILLLYCLPAIWTLDKGLFAWAWILGVVPAMSGTFVSFTRFESVVFPLFIALGVVLSKPGWRVVRWGLLSVFFVLHAVLVWRFVNFQWAG